jgi:hypothetical protein
MLAPIVLPHSRAMLISGGMKHPYTILIILSIIDVEDVEKICREGQGSYSSLPCGILTLTQGCVNPSLSDLPSCQSKRHLVRQRTEKKVSELSIMPRAKAPMQW